MNANGSAKRYRNGVPCLRGHVAERYVSNGRCVECATEFVRRRRATTDYERRWHEANRERVRAKHRDYAGLPKPTRPEPAGCEICGGHPSRRFRSLSVDHCHATGEFRGWLCGSCNTALGKFGDSHEALVDWFQKASRYLQRER